MPFQGPRGSITNERFGYQVGGYDTYIESRTIHSKTLESEGTVDMLTRVAILMREVASHRSVSNQRPLRPLHHGILSNVPAIAL
jgi:hypothetical protein